MAQRNENQWALYNLAEIGRNPEVYNTKEEALAVASKWAEDQDNPFIRIDEQSKWIDYRGKVFL